MAEPIDYYREGALVGQPDQEQEFLTQEEAMANTPLLYREEQMLGVAPPQQRGDIGLAYEKGKRLLTGSASVQFKGFTGELLKNLGLEEAGNEWLSSAYQSGIMMGIDVNELDSQLKGPKTLEDIEDWKGAVAWGVNAVAEQVPNLATTFAPAVIGTLLFKKFPRIGKTTVTAGTLGTIDFLNTAEVYTDLMMETGESRPVVAATTGTLMSMLDIVAPFAIISRMKAGPDFAKHFLKKIRDPKSGFANKLATAIGTGAAEGTTEYVQTMFEGFALNYVQENDLFKKFSEAQKAEQIEAGARGALVGTLLGIPVAYSGFSARRAANKFKKSASQNIVDKLRAENAIDEQSISPELSGTLALPRPPALSEFSEEVFRSPISESEFRIFRDTGEIAPQRLFQIATKISRSEDLDPNEFSIYSDRGSEIEELVVGIRTNEETSARIKQAVAKTKRQNILSLINSTNVPVSEVETLLGLGTIEQARASAQRDKEIKESAGLYRIIKGAEGDAEAEERRTTKGRGKETQQRTIREFPFSRRSASQIEAERLVGPAREFVGPEREVRRLPPPKPTKKTVSRIEPTKVGKRSLRRTETQTTQDILTAPEKQTGIESLGWRRTATTPALNKDGSVKYRNKATGDVELISTYETEDYRLEKSKPTRKASWLVVNKVTGDTVDLAFGAGGLNKLAEKYAPDLTVDKAAQESQRKESEGIALEQKLSEQGRLAPQKGDKVSFYGKPRVFATKWTVDKKTKRQVKAKPSYEQRVLRTFELDVDQPNKDWRYLEDKTYTIVKDPQVRKNGDTVYVLEPESGESFEFIMTKELSKNLRLGIKRKAARKYPESLAPPVAETEIVAAEQKELGIEDEEVQSLTKEGEQKRRIKNISAFYDRLASDEDFRESVIQSIAKASIIEPAIETGSNKRLKAFAKKGHNLQFVFPAPKDNIQRLAIAPMEDIEQWLDSFEGVTVTERGNMVEFSARIEESVRPDTVDAEGNVVLSGTKTRVTTEGIQASLSKWKKTLKSTKALTTRKLNARESLGKKKETERPSVTNLIDDIDPQTRSKPTPLTHDVIISNKAAEEHNLDRGVSYPWKEISLTVDYEPFLLPEKKDDSILVAGQVVKKTDVVGIKLVPAVRGTSPLTKGRTRKLLKLKNIPDVIPDAGSVEAAYVEPITGAFVIKRISGEAQEGLSSNNQIDVYIQYNNRKEHAVKLRSLMDELLNLEKAVDKTIKTETVVLDKSRDKKSKAKKPKNVRQIEKILSENLGSTLRTSNIGISLKPSVYQKIRRQSNLKDLDNAFRVLPRETRKGTVVIRIPDGTTARVSIDSIQTLTQTKVTQGGVSGIMLPYETEVEQGPEKGVTLISSFKDVGNVEKFNDLMGQLLGSINGVLDERIKEVKKSRSEALKNNIGRRAVFEMTDGSIVSGKIERVNDNFVGLKKDDKLFGLPLDRYARVQIAKEKPTYVAEGVEPEDIGPPGSMLIYTPVYKGEDVDYTRVPLPDKEIDLGPSVVNVYYRKNTNDFSINVDGIQEQEGLSVASTVNYLNQMVKLSEGNVTIQRLPLNIKRERKILSKGTGLVDTFEFGINNDMPLTGKPSPSGRLRSRPDVVDQTNAEIAKEIDDQAQKAAKDILDAAKKVSEDKKKADIDANAKRNSQVASNTTRTFEEVKDTPFINLPPNQKFRDKNGGLWRVMDTVGRNNTSVQFLGGTAPDINFQVTWEGKKAEGKFEKNFIVTVRGSSTPSTMEIKADNKRFYNYSIVAPVPADGNGSIKYNTGLTPKRFMEILGSKIGRLNIKRLIEKGLIKVVQNQQDMQRPPLDLAVKAVTRNGEVVFITNNIKEEEVVSVFVHEVGVHVGLKEVYGADFASLIQEVKSRRGTEGWENAFQNAEIVADKFSFTDDIARDNFIAEEALAYYIESNNNFKDSLWQSFLDLISRWVARTKMWFGGKLTDDQLVAFARGAVRGMSERNFENAINAVDEEYYSQNADAFDKVAETFDKYGAPFDSSTRREYVGKASGLWDATKKFFDPFAKLPFGRLFRKFRSELQGRLGEIQELADDVYNAYDGLNEQENQEIFDFFTTKDASPDMISRKDLRESSVALKQKIMQIADDGLLRGMYPEASQDQMEELRGAYLPRVFMYHIIKSGGTRGAGQRKASKRDYAKLRIETLDEDLREMWGEVKDVRYLLYRAVTIPQQDIAIIDFLSAISESTAFKETPEAERIKAEIDRLRIARQDENVTDERRAELLSQIGDLSKELKNLQKEGKRFVAGQIPWVMPNQWVRVKLRTKDGVKIINTTLASINRQIEAYKTYESQAPNISDKARNGILEQIASLEEARKEFLDSVGVDKNLNPNDVNDASAIQSQIDKYYDDNFDISLFRKMPNDTDRYGSMANLYVRREIYEDIMGNSDMVTGEQNLFQRMLLPYGKHAKLVSIFKTMKVPLNPPTVVRNFIANLIMMQLFGGVAFRRQPALLMEALREMRGGERGTVFKDAQGNEFTAFELAMKQGIGATTLTNAELNKLEKVFSFMEKQGVWGLATKGQHLWNQIADFGSNLYQGIETLGKVVVINDMLQNQRAELEKILAESDSAGVLTIEDIAVQEANRVLFDYSEVHPTVRGLRSSFLGAPFITYQVKVLPQLAKILSDPSKYHRFLPYVMMIGSMQALFGSIPFMDDDWDKMEELLPEWTRDNTMAFLPWRDSNGNWQAVDLSYFFPWTWFMQTGSNLMKGEVAKAAVEGGIVGPAWQLMTTFITGKDPWSGYQIVNQNDSTSDKMFDYMSYANSMIMPPWLTRNGIVSVSSLAEAMGRLDPTELEGKLPDLLLGRTNRYGEPKRSAMGVIGSAVGLTTYAVSPQARTIENKRYAS